MATWGINHEVTVFLIEDLASYLNYFFLSFRILFLKLSRPAAWCQFYMRLNEKTEGVPKDVEGTVCLWYRIVPDTVWSTQCSQNSDIFRNYWASLREFLTATTWLGIAILQFTCYCDWLLFELNIVCTSCTCFYRFKTHHSKDNCWAIMRPNIS